MGSLWSSTSLVTAAVILVAALIAFRVFGRIRFTFRFRGAVTVSPWAQKPCPHLGLLDEPFIHRDDPSEEHRCYLWMQRDRIDRTHQKGFCLSSAHTHCPWMSIAPPLAKAPISRRLRVAAPGVLGVLGANIANSAAIFLVWLVLRLKRANLVLGQWTDAAVPVVVTLAVIAAHAAANGGSVAGKAIGRASLKSGRATAVWLKANAIHLARLSRDAAKEAWAARSAPTSTPAPTTGNVKPAEVAAVEQPTPAAPSLPPVTGKGALSHAESLVEQGKTAGMSGNRKLAYSLFSLALDLDPKDDEAWLWKGAMAESAEEKFVCLQQALTINPNNQRAQQAFRSFQRKEGEAQGAAAAGSRTAPEPGGERGRVPATAMGAFNSEEALIAAALVALERGDEEGANRLFVRATELSPGSEKAWFWRAKTSATLSDVIYSLQQALAINPGNEKVRANLLWAIQRQQREEESAEAERKVAKEEAKAKKEEAKSRRSPVARGFSWVATLVCLALAAYWVLAALSPLFELPALSEAFVEVQRLAEVDLSDARPLYEAASNWLPGFDPASLPWQDKLEVAPGYNLLAAAPYVVGFLYLFVAIGLARRENWSRFWAVAATIFSLALLAVSGLNSPGAGFAGALGLMTILALLLSRREFRRETGESSWQQGHWGKTLTTPNRMPEVSTALQATGRKPQT